MNTQSVSRNTRVGALLILLALLVGASANAQEKVQLLHKAQKGQRMTYQLEGNFAMEVAGNKVTFEMKLTYQDTIRDIAATGEITRERVLEEMEVTVNGQKMPVPEEANKGKQVVVMKPDGTIVSVELEEVENEKRYREQQWRMAQPFALIYPAQPVGVGDKWSYEYKEDEEKGIVAAVTEYEVLGFEKVKGIETVKLKLDYQETGSDKGKMSVSGEVWVEKASGDLVTAEVKMEGVPFRIEAHGEMRPSITGTLRIERTAGSPIGIAAPDQQPTAPDKKKEKTLEEIVKDYEKLEGIFTLYRKKEAGKDTLYMEIREDQLDQLLLLQVTASSGTGGFGLVAGDPIADILFKFVRRDEQLLFVVPNIGFAADEKKPIARAVKRSFADAYLEAFKIEAKSAERKSLLINVTDLFRSDIARITLLATFAGGGSYSIDKEKTAFNYVKVFPTNLVVQTAYHLSRGLDRGGVLPFSIPGLTIGAPLADPRSLPIVINYNLFFLPVNNGYRPRLADPRVGYFVTEYQDFTEDKEEQTKRYILRWHLEKSDPNAKLSPPKEPIVFWLDNAIPTEYRDAVRRGLLLWNRAFERIGIKEAIVVKQMPDDADWDHADMRYNVIRWVTSPASGYAVALFRANPLTGQILNASITVDANMTRFTKLEFKRMVDPLSGLQEEDHPHLSDPRRCSYAEEVLPHAWLGFTAMNLLAGSAATKVTEKRYLEDFITEVVAHEMGHILGLRHNFIASTLHPLKALANGERVRQNGVVSSVMDYNPFNLMALHAPNTEYWTTTLGPYDRWAIEYGYLPIKASSPEAEKPTLQRIASRCNEWGLAYQSDEIADQFDPLVTRFDLSSNPLEYWALMFRDLRRLIDLLPKRIPERGESYWQFTRYFNGLINMYGRAGIITSRYIGGLHIRGNHRGDPGEQFPLVPVKAEDQKRALALLREYIFSKNAFNFPKSLYLKLAPNPFPDWTSFLTGSLRQDAPIRDTISAIQRNILNRLFNPSTLNRMVNNEFKSPNPNATLNLPTLFRTVTDAVWEELRIGGSVDSLRRLLQRAYLQIMVDMLTKLDSPAPEDAKMLARYHLRQLKGALQKNLPKAKDEYTRVHYAEALEMINKALEAKYMLTQPAPPARPFSIWDLLGSQGSP